MRTMAHKKQALIHAPVFTGDEWQEHQALRF